MSGKWATDVVMGRTVDDEAVGIPATSILYTRHRSDELLEVHLVNGQQLVLKRDTISIGGPTNLNDSGRPPDIELESF